MKERIKQCAIKAVKYADTYADKFSVIWFEKYNEHLEELIIQECLNLVDKQSFDSGEDNGLRTVISQYFGVE
jgi:hypothetical protein